MRADFAYYDRRLLFSCYLCHVSYVAAIFATLFEIIALLHTAIAIIVSASAPLCPPFRVDAFILFCFIDTLFISFMPYSHITLLSFIATPRYTTLLLRHYVAILCRHVAMPMLMRLIAATPLLLTLIAAHIDFDAAFLRCLRHALFSLPLRLSFDAITCRC